MKKDMLGTEQPPGKILECASAIVGQGKRKNSSKQVKKVNGTREEFQAKGRAAE